MSRRIETDADLEPGVVLVARRSRSGRRWLVRGGPGERIFLRPLGTWSPGGGRPRGGVRAIERTRAELRAGWDRAA
jgi:hypothetical protein